MFISRNSQYVQMIDSCANIANIAVAIKEDLRTSKKTDNSEVVYILVHSLQPVASAILFGSLPLRGH